MTPTTNRQACAENMMDTSMAETQEREGPPNLPPHCCRMEQCDLQTIEAQRRFFAILGPMALCLLMIRQAAHQAEGLSTMEVSSPETVQVITHLDPPTGCATR